MPVDLNLMVGGEAGQGIQTIGFVLGKSFTRGGLHVFADQDYESRVRGGHNFFRIRVSDKELACQTEKVDILVALNKQTLDLHRSKLNQNGLVIADYKALNIEKTDKIFIDAPLEELAVQSSGSKIMSNSVAVGCVAGILKFDFEIVAGVLREQFSKNNLSIQEENIKAAKAGFEFAVGRIPSGFNVKWEFLTNSGRLFINGNEAIALGALAAGCKFVAAYPMTPTTPILEYLADKGRFQGMAVVQPEDEISAINMVIGASYAGVRSLTATSGSGFALMIEGIGLSGMTEIPAVVILGQRPGPAIGLPTRTEQGELLLAINSGTGEFPRVVLAPRTIEEAFFLTARAFNLADKFQIPVILMTDTFLGHSYADVPRFDLAKVKIDRGDLLSDEQAANLTDYKRYQITPEGVSPRAIPGQSKLLVICDSDEHDETGHLTESAEIRIQQVSKRLRKNSGLKKEIEQPLFLEDSGAGITLIGWGSTYGAIKETSGILKTGGIPNSVLLFNEIWPFPSEFVSEALRKTKRNFVIENNATGQLASVIQSQTGFMNLSRINKWDGRPISSEYILNELKKEGI
jgi:2-oxoglutarate/2-oxoacid ferredoxin oxidoreductase subunit alpha